MIYYGDLSNNFLQSPYTDIKDRVRLLESLEKSNFEEYQGPLPYDIETPPEDILAYWDSKSEFGQSLKQRIHNGISPLLEAEESVILIAHSLGAVLSYDQLSLCTGSAEHVTLMTLGSPLSHPQFEERKSDRFPTLAAWHNVSAKGDKICGPRNQELVDQEHEIINPLIKEGEPDPHHALGYLRHPGTANILGEWLSQQ